MTCVVDRDRELAEARLKRAKERYKQNPCSITAQVVNLWQEELKLFTTLREPK